MIWYLLVGMFIFLFFKGNVMKKIEEVKKWYQLNKDKLKEWEGDIEVKNAFEKLKKAVENAQLDKKWDAGEILYVIGLAYNLFKLIKEHEEK